MFSWPSFLNTSLLFGAAAFAVPLIIHLLHRTRFTTMEWGAMFFLDEMRRVQTRRLEWQSLLLLLIRCMIPVLLALCMARPLLSGRLAGAMAGSGQPKVTTILLDNSVSMKVESSEKPTTVMEKAKALAGELVRNSPRQGRWSILPLSHGRSVHDERVFSRERSSILASIEELPTGLGSGRLVEALEKAVDDLEKENEPNTRITVISDFQKSLFGGEEEAKWLGLRQRLAKLDNPPTIVMLPCESAVAGGSNPENVTVRFDRQSRSIVGVGQPWEARVIVRNFGKQKPAESKLILLVDDVPMVSKSISVPAESETQASFSLAFPVAGSHRIEARIDVDDALPDDNHTTWSVFAIGTIPVLIVDPTVDANAERADSDFLQAALSPYATSAKTREELFAVRRISPDKLTGKEIEESRILLLVDVASLSDDSASRLQDFVRSGGVLGVFLGDRAEADWYNKRLFLEAGVSIATRSDEDKDSLGTMTIRREPFQHPAFRFLNDARMVGLESLELRRRHSIAVASEKVDVVMRMNNGDPWLLEYRLESGRVLVSATSCDDKWTNWPVRPLFLPMIQQWLVTATPIESWTINTETDSTLGLPADALIEWLALGVKPDKTNDSSKPTRLGFRGEASGATAELKPDSMIVATRPGFYEIGEVGEDDESVEKVASQPSASRRKNGGGSEEVRFIASAQLPMAESNLERVSTADMRLLADRVGAKLVDSLDGYFELSDPSGRELWRWLLVGLLFFLFAELLLQRSFVGARR